MNRFLNSATFRAMARPFVFGPALIFGIALACAPHVLSQPEDIFIENGADGLKRSRPGVTFPHELHMDSIDCLDCHHDYQDGENLLDDSELEEDGSAACSACHSKSATIDLKTAYHRQCIKCHRTWNRESDGALPITCRDCHPRIESVGK